MQKAANQTNRLLVFFVDDLIQIRRGVKHSLEMSPVDDEGMTYHFQVETFDSLRTFESRAGKVPAPPDILLLDIHMDENPDAGFTLVEHSRTLFPQAAIIMFSQIDDAETIVRFLNCGADNFISKETEIDKLGKTLLHSFKLASTRRNTAPSEIPCRQDFPNIAGDYHRKVAMRVPNIINSAIRAVHTYGETGTGKELISDLFERLLPEKVPFIRVNCGAIAPGIMESELFGHKKGAFTGADRDKKGLLEAADGGWIFLDEVALLSENVQMALLRCIENREVRPLGASMPRTIDFRVISATNENLAELVRKGRFRKDLWQRLCELTISIPPLRERAEEIPHIARSIAEDLDGGPYVITPTAMKVLSKYHWSDGNVRELRNCLRAMTENAMDRVFVPGNIPSYILSQLRESEPAPEERDESVICLHPDWNDFSYRDLENQLLKAVVTATLDRFPVRSMRELATRTGIPRTTFNARIRRLIECGMLDEKELNQALGHHRDAADDG